jgi:hypothetical protein
VIRSVAHHIEIEENVIKDALSERLKKILLVQ